MNKVEIKYDWKVWRWYLRRRLKRDVPDQWDELTEKQLTQVMEVLYMNRSEREKQILCLKVIMNLHWQFLFGVMADADVDQILYLTDFLFADINLQKNLISKLRVGSRHYCGPVDGLRGMTAAEFMSSDMYFMKYIKTQVKDKNDRSKVLIDGHDEDHWLNLFVATLYRPMDGDKYKKWNRSQERRWFRLERSRNMSGKSSGIDLREPFDQDTIEVRATIFKRMPKAMKLAILNWYRSCRNVWENSLTRVFSGNNQSTASSYGWFEVMKNVSADDFGTLEQKANVPIFNIFLSMEVDMKNEEKRKRNLKKGGK